MITTIRRKAAAALISSGMVTGVFMAQAAPSGAATFTVNPGESIQAAIDAAPPGSTIQVNPGTYRQNVTIAKDGITLQGTPGQTILKPPSRPKGGCAFPGDSGGPVENTGICVIGNFDFETFTLITPVTGVSVTGFTVKNFPNQGIFVLGGETTLVQNNRLVGNGGYGVFANTSTGTRILANKASGSGEAGIYVGDSPAANAVVKNNEVFDNGFGMFIRSAVSGSILSNNSHDNCFGILFLNEPNSSDSWAVTNNQVNHNTRACPASEESPPLSGGGIVVLGSHNLAISKNTVNDNAPGGPTIASGGIILSGGAAANVVSGNSAHGNVPADLIDDDAPANTYIGNSCGSSIPPGLCATP